MLIFSVLLVSITTACLPFILDYLAKNSSDFKTHKANNYFPLLAGLLYLTAWFVPDIHISDSTSTFQQHFIGGGLYCAVLYIYFKQVFAWRFGLIRDLVILFAWVSAFGVANELLEFAVNGLGINHINTQDSDWDLLANTLGAFFGYFLYLFAKNIAKRHA